MILWFARIDEVGNERSNVMCKVNLLGVFFLWTALIFRTIIPAYGFNAEIEKDFQKDDINDLIAERGEFPLSNQRLSNPQCDANVPYFVVDLTGDPDSTWFSPSLGREGNCCNTTHPDRCVSFTVILDENAIGLEFDITDGAIPNGSLFYQIDCGVQQLVGNGICLAGGQTYELTFCKPGANKNVYRIRSIPGIIIPDTISTRVNCSVDVDIKGVDASSVHWNSITGSTYNSYLSCTSGCLTNTIKVDHSAPSTILYEVCGDATDKTCGGIFHSCDTLVVKVYPEVEVSITGDLTFCNGSSSTLIASATPASPAYSFEWYDNYNATGNIVSTTTDFIPTSAGAYSVVATDHNSSLECSSDTLNFDITVLDCLPQSPKVTICPDSSVTFTRVSDFVSSGGVTNFSCPVNDSNIQLIGSNTDGGTCPEIITQTYEIWDDCGNRASCDVQIIRTDMEAPVLSGVPGDITVVCSTPPIPPVIYTDITATDNCDPNVEITMAETSTQTFDNSYTSVVYQIVRTWTATDHCGNSTSMSQTINMICEYCYNGIDDDGDGAIDESDPDCPCSYPSYKLTCENIQYYYVPPVWQMNPSFGGGSVYTDPSSLVISTPFGKADVTIRTADGSFQQSIRVNQGTAEVVPLTNNIIQTPNYNSIENDKGLIIESDQLIQLIYRISANNNKMLVTIKGEQALGQRFRAGSQTNAGGAPDTGKRENHFISVMAVEDNTTVNFEFTAAMKDLGSTHFVTLNAGETYLMIDDDNNQTVTGSLITSDRPIAVITGSQHSRQRNGQNGRDAGADQLIPTCGVGTDYVVTRGQDDDDPSEANYAVVVGVTSNTEVFINGSGTPVASLNPGEFYTYDMPGPNFSRHYIQTSNPAYLYQFGSVQNNGEIGMAIAAPIDGCRGDRFVEFYRFPNSTVNKVTALVPNAGLSTLTFNGNPYTDYTTAESIPGLPSWSVVTFDDASLNNYNIIESDKLFNASQFVGNSSGGTFGYLTSFKDKIVVYDPHTNLPAYNYFADTICADSPYNHCINSSSCSGNQFITSIIGSSHTGSYTITPNSTCFEYIPKTGYNGMDTITVLLSDDFGFTQAVCIGLYICGTLPEIDGITDSIATCAIGEIPPYVDFNEFLADGGSASDDCSGLDISSFSLLSETSDGNTCPETITRVYEISNECGLTSEFTQRIVINNTNIPSLTGIPNDTTVNCDAVPGPPVIGTDIVGASFCGIPPAIDLDETRVDGTCPNNYQLIRTWTVTDECGNSSTVSQIITINDDTPPLISCIPDITVANIAALPPPAATFIDFMAQGGSASDNCELDSTSFTLINEVSRISGGNKIITRRYEIADLCGNTTICEQDITITDSNINSTNPIDDVVECIDEVPGTFPTFRELTNRGGNATSSCGIDTTTFVLVSESSDGNTCPEVITRIYELTDSCGHTVSIPHQIVVDDLTPPVINCMPDTIVLSAPPVPFAVTTFDDFLLEGGFAFDNCELDSTSFVLLNEVASHVSGNEMIIRTYQIADLCGNVATCDQEITVGTPTTGFDDPDEVLVACIDELPTPLSTYRDLLDNGGSVSSTCGIDTTSFALVSEQSDGNTCPEIITRTYEIADSCGNVINLSQQIVVDDMTGSVINCLPDTTVAGVNFLPPPLTDLDEFIAQGGTVSDNCEPDSISFTLINEVTNVSGSNDVITRTYQIVDQCGNIATCDQKITVGTPTTGFDDPDEVLVTCIDELPTPLSTYRDLLDNGGSVSSTCGIDTTSFALVSEQSDGNTCPEIITRTYEIADSCGNVINLSQQIVVDDMTGSVINCLPDTTVAGVNFLPPPLTDLDEFIAQGGTVSDNCEPDSISFTLINEVTNVSGSNDVITRTYQIVDQCGNIATCDQKITIFPPVVTTVDPLEETYDCIDQLPVAYHSFQEMLDQGGNVTSTCGIDTSSFSLITEISDGNICPEIITRTYEVADSCGNRISITQRITVDDPIDPVIICLPDTIIYNTPIIPLPISTLDDFILNGGNASDNCEPDSSSFLLVSELSRNVGGNNITTRTYQISDKCGNVATCEQEIIQITTINNPPEANDDRFEGGCFIITGNLIENDTDPDGHDLIMNTNPVHSPNHGMVTLYADGAFVYDFEPNTTAIDSFTYEVCDDTYDFQCDQATVYITLFKDNNCDGIDDDIYMDSHDHLDEQDGCELLIPEGFSPNGDGVHDFFRIYCINKYPNAKLLIFDRWGNKLYEHENYGNIDFWGSYEKAWWDGTITRDPNRKVRPETHLYILETGPGKSRRGFVMVSY